MHNKKTSNSGVGLCGATFLIFLFLKLAEIGPVTKWSWWWVTCPLWIGLLTGIIIGMIVGLISYATYKLRSRKYRKQKEETENIQPTSAKSFFQQKLDEKMKERK